MPIYAYKCESCGHAKDVLQKISDAPLSECPACGAAAFRKQVTAAGFQLKGSGWYATDFRNGSKPPADPAKGAEGESTGKADSDSAKPSESKAGETKAAESKPSTKAPDAPAASAGAER